MTIRQVGAALVALVVLVAGLYAGSPYWAVRDLQAAAKAGDAEKLERLVDFPSVRESMKSQLNAMMLKSMQSDPEMSDNPFAGLALLMVPAIIDRSVETLVTPDAIGTMLMTGDPKDLPEAAVAPDSQPPLPASSAEPKARINAGYKDLNTFRVSSTNPNDPAAEVQFILRRHGLFSWRMTRIQLPSNVMSN